MTITREQAYQELFGSDSAQTANSPQSGGFSREQAYQELFGNDGTVQPNSAGTNDTNSGLFNLPKNSTPFFPSANAVGDVTGIIVDAFGHTVNAVEQLTSPLYRATDTGIALKRWLGDDSDKPNLYGKAIIDFSKNNLHSDEYNRQVEQGQANSAAIEQQLNQQKRAGTISEAEAFATDAVASARNLFENPALLGQGLSTAIPSLATLVLTQSPIAAAAVGAGMGGAEVLENNQHFIDSVPQTLLSQSPVYQTLIQKGLSDGEARYYLANDLTEHGWHVAAAGGSEAVLDRLMFGKFLKPTGSVAKTTLQSGAMEGGQEVVQNTVSNDAIIRLAERLGIPTNKMRSDGAGNAFVLGAATGITMGGGSALLNSGTNPKTDSEQFNREIAESSQETSEQATRTEVDRTKLKEAFAPFAESLDENEYEALWQELVTDIEQGDLSEAMASEDREYATIARAYAQAVGFEAQNASPTEGRVKVDNVDSVVGEIVRPQSAISGAEVQIELGSQGTKTAQYELVEADELEVNLKPNLYQNRDRTTVDSQAQIAEYASNLKPAYLGGSVDVTQGAPTVSQSYGVFAGNGRLAAIKQAYAKNPQNATAYRDYLAQNAPQFGFTAEQVQGMKQPVLVRKVAGNIDLKKAVEEGNFNTGLDKGVIGNAKANADYISDELLDLVEINEDGSLNLSESNTPFISSLVSRIPVEQRPQFFAEKKQGNQTAYTLTAQGRELVENALLVKAYSDGSSYADNLLTDLITGTEEGNKRVKAALTAIAGKVIQTKGTEYDISADLVQAYDLMSRGKKAGLNATEAANQGDLLNPPNETVQGLVGLFYSPKSISEVQQPLNAYLGKVIDSKLHQTEQGGLFEDENPTSEALLREAGLRFSRNNQPKNASENIARGRQAMEFAIENQTDVANAMYREGLGWVDFIWGTEGKVNPNKDKRKGAKGVSHIIEKRMNVDHLTRDEVVDFLENTVPEIIALGSVANDFAVSDKRRMVIALNGNEVHLVKEGNNNAWLLTGFQQKNQEMNQSRGATTSDLRSTDPIRSRIDEVALGSNNVRSTTQDVNPQIQQDKATLERILGQEIAAHIELIDGEQFAQMNRDESLENLRLVEGFFDPKTNKAYIVSDQITARAGLSRDENLVWVAWHELSHKGLAGLLGHQLQNALRKMQSNPVIARLVEARQAMFNEKEMESVEEVIVELSSAMYTGKWDSLTERYGIELPATIRRANSHVGKALNTFERALKRIVGSVIGRDLSSDFAVIDLLSGLQREVQNFAKNSENQTASGDARYSLNERADSAFAKAVDEVANGQQAEQKIINVGTTPDVLKMLGLPDVSVIIHANTLSKVMHDKHSVAPEVLKAIPAQINNPVAVMKSETQPNGYVVLTELVEQENGKDKPVIAALHLKQDKNGLELINIASVYGRSNSQIQRGLENDLLYWNNEKGAKFLDNFTLQLRSSLSENSSIGGDIKTEADLSQYQAENSARYSRKPQELSESAYNQAKADGKTELTFQQWKQVRSPEFKRWFGDWENDPENASKVVNPRTGEPLVVYHGTPKSRKFNIFKTTTGTIWVSSNRYYSTSAYAGDKGRVYDLFANIKNPVFVGDISSSVTASSIERLSQNSGIHTSELENIANKIQAKEIWEITQSQEFAKILKDKGGDGINAIEARFNTFAGFNSNQIKSATDNNGEFSAENEDIRYSRRARKDLAEKAMPKRTANSYDEARSAVTELLGEPLTNRQTGMIATISKRALDKLLSGKAVEKSSNLHDHLTAVANIDGLFENAIKGWVEPHKSDTVNIAGMQKLFAPLLIDNEMKLAKITVKEMNFDQGNKIYSVETIEVENEKGDLSLSWKPEPSVKTTLTSQQIADVQSLIQQIADFNSNGENKNELLSYSHRITNPGTGKNNSFFDKFDDKRLLQILQDETSLESENTRYSRPPSVLEQLDSGEVYMPTEGILAAIKQGELKQAYLQSKDTLYESMVDETLPVDRWAEGMPIDPMTAKALISAKDRAEGIRMDLNTRVTEQFIRPVMKNLMALADKHNLDVLMAKHIAQYWYSARYSIEKNLELLQREEQAMKEAKKELADAKQKGDPDEIAKLARAERRATRKYKDRYHDVHLNNWQKGADGKYLISRKVGTAGGWSIPHARAIMAKAEQYIPAREIEAALKPLQDAVKWNIATNLAHGRISPAQAAEYRQKPHYVPLTGDPYTELHEMDNSSDFLSGAGSGGVNTARDHHLDGRQESEADGAIDAIMGMLDKTNANSGWSEFKFLIDDIYETALRDTLSNHPNLTLTQAKNEVYTRYGIRKQRLSGITRTSDKVIIRKFEGISYQYTLPDKVIDALIAGTTDSDGRAAWAFITTIPRNLTRWLARGVTQFTPTFALTNMISDLMDKGDLLMSEKITANGKQMTFFERAKLQMKLYANVPLSWKATTTFAFKGASALNNQRKMQRNLNRLLELGGISNYNTYLAQNRESLNKELQDMGKLHKKAFNATLTLVAGWNAIFDYTSSLAMFTTLTDAGVDEKQAATLVLNQMNFRKQGSFAKYGKPFYMFLNPSIQGTAKTVKSLKTRGGQAMFAFNLLVFFAIYAWAVSGADEDETGNDMMSNPFYPREIQLKLFGSELRIPIGFGQKQLAWGIVVNTIKAYEGQITYANAAANILSNTTKSLSPIAPSEVSPDKEPITWLINTFSPSIAKPFLQIGQNRNSFGTPIVNENRHNKLPVAYQGKPETAEFWKELAEQVYQNTEGKLNIHPEIYKHMFDSYRGILGSFGQYLSNQIENPALAERGKRERVLFLDRFYREVGDNKVQSMYYRAKEEMKPLLEQSELHKQQGTWNKWVTPEKRKRLKWYLDGESTLNKLYLEKSRLEKMRRLDRIRGTNQLSDERFSERVKLINSRIEKVQRQQIHEWRKMEGVRTTLPK